MLSASAGYKTAVSGYSRKWSAQILDGNNTPMSCEIMGVEVHKGTRGRDYQIGTMYAPHFTGTIRGYTGALMGETLQFQLGLEVSGSTEWVTICTGTVYQITENGDDLSFTAAGVLATAGDLIVTEQGTDITDIITDIETLTGVTVSAVGAASTIGLTGTLAQSMDGLDVRTALQYIAGVFGGFVSEGADGGIVIGNVYSGTQVQVTDDEIQKLPDSSGSFDITGFEVIVTAGGVDASGTVIPDVSYTDGTVVLTSVNPYMTQTLFNSVKSYVTGLTVYAGTIEQTMGNPLIEPWDIVYNDAYSDLRGSEIVITYNGGVSCSITSELTTTEEVSTVQTGPMSAQISKIEDKLYTIQDGLNYFWVDSSGAHVTQVPKDQFLASPQGGNTLINSDGLQVRDAETVLAGFSAAGAQLGSVSSANAVVTPTDMTFMNENGLEVFKVASSSVSQSTGVTVQLLPSTAEKVIEVHGSKEYRWTMPSTPSTSTMDMVIGVVYAGTQIYTTSTVITADVVKQISGPQGTGVIILFTSATDMLSITAVTGIGQTLDLHKAQITYTTTAYKPTMTAGTGTQAQYGDQTAIGAYNDNKSGNLFEIGNGTADNARSNAFEVTDTGDVTVAGDASITGDLSADDISAAGGITVTGTSTLTGNVTASGTVTVQGHASAIGTLVGDLTGKTLTSVNASTSWQQVSSMSLSEGRWLCKGWASFNGSTAGTRYIYITSSASPSDSTVAAVGNFSQYMGASAHGLVAGTTILDVSSTTTFYLYIKTAAGSPAVPYCQLEAIRIA